MTTYHNLRRTAYKKLCETMKTQDAHTRLVAKLYFIDQVDVKIFENVKKQLIAFYKTKFSTNPEEATDKMVKDAPKELCELGMHNFFLSLMAKFYTEIEISVDIVRRLQLYGLGSDASRTYSQAMLAQILHAWKVEFLPPEKTLVKIIDKAPMV